MSLASAVLQEGAHAFVFHVVLPHQCSTLSADFHALSISQHVIQN